MDWLQFIASIFGSLAWPGAFVFFLFLVRKHLGPLLSRLVELHLPGGAKAVFQSALESARKEAETIEPPPRPVGRARTRDSATFVGPSGAAFESVQKNPQLLILNSYAGLENILSEIRSKLSLPGGMSNTSVIQILIEKMLVKPSVLMLFDKLRNARNAMVHVPDKEVTVLEAMQFSTHAGLLREVFADAQNKLPPKKEGQ